MAITGNLETMSLAELLQWLANGRQTGTLMVNNGSVEKKIYLRDGAVLSSSSSDPRGFLGHFLVSKGVISEDDLAKAMAVQSEQGKLLGEILVEGGAIDQEMLDYMLRLKAEENIYDLFAWDEGHFEFLDEELPPYELVPMSANITGLVMEGMRRIDMSKEIEKVIPSIQCVPVSVAPLLDEDEMDFGWRGVLEAVDDDRSVEDICLHTHSSEFFVCQVLHRKLVEKLDLTRMTGDDDTLREQVREVLMLPDTMTRVPGAQRWMLGIANLRGHLLPLVDVKLLLGSGRTTLRRTTRVISVNHREIPAGIVVDEVIGFRRFGDHEFSDAWPETAVRCDRFLSGAYRRGEEAWPVFDLFSLIESKTILPAHLKHLPAKKRKDGQPGQTPWDEVLLSRVSRAQSLSRSLTWLWQKPASQKPRP